MDIAHLGVALAVLIFSTAAHEAAHALAWAWQGDRTALQQGRATLNPWRHADVFWTLLMPVVLFVVSSGALIFGLARPAPSTVENLPRPATGTLVSIGAALATNLLIALFSVSALVLLRALSPAFVQPDSLNAYLIAQLAIVNLLLVAVHVVFPIAPLDLSKLVRLWLTRRGQELMDAAEPLGYLAVMLLLALLFAGRAVDPMFQGIETGFAALFDPAYARGLIENLRRAQTP